MVLGTPEEALQTKNKRIYLAREWNWIKIFSLKFGRLLCIEIHGLYLDTFLFFTLDYSGYQISYAFFVFTHFWHPNNLKLFRSNCQF